MTANDFRAAGATVVVVQHLRELPERYHIPQYRDTVQAIAARAATVYCMERPDWSHGDFVAFTVGDGVRP